MPDFIKGRLEARRGHFNRDLFSLRGCWTDYRPTVASSRNDDVMVSVFAKCKYQIGGSYVLDTGFILAFQREENTSHGERFTIVHVRAESNDYKLNLNYFLFHIIIITTVYLWICVSTCLVKT